MNTVDNIRDVAIRITDKLVNEGIIVDCIDTEDETEFSVQDVIFAEILREKALELYFKDTLTKQDEDIINEAIDIGILETDDILDSFVGYVEETNFFWKLDFAEHYQNGLTHKKNFENFKNWLKH
jgi:hypothetical protein